MVDKYFVITSIPFEGQGVDEFANPVYAYNYARDNLEDFVGIIKGKWVTLKPVVKEVTEVEVEEL